MTLPAASLLLVFFALPLALLVPASLCEFDVRMRPTFVGLTNFRALLVAPLARSAVGATMSMGVMALVMVISTGVAGGVILATMKWRVRIRRMFMLLSMTSGTSVSVFWVWLFMPFWGGLAKLQMALGMAPTMWHASAALARLSSAILVWVWMFPAQIWIISVFISAMPQDLLDAARVDGANAWQMFWHVALPVLRRPFSYILLTDVAGMMQVYEAPQVLWQGGPGGGTRGIIAAIITRMGGQHGLAAAFALCFALALGIVCGIAWRLGEREK